MNGNIDIARFVVLANAAIVIATVVAAVAVMTINKRKPKNPLAVCWKEMRVENENRGNSETVGKSERVRKDA